MVCTTRSAQHHLMRLAPHCDKPHCSRVRNCNLKIIQAKNNMSLLPRPLAQLWKSKFEIRSKEKQMSFRPGPFAKLWSLKFDFLLAQTNMSLLQRLLAEVWKLEFEIHTNKKHCLFASIATGPVWEIHIWHSFLQKTYCFCSQPHWANLGN